MINIAYANEMADAAYSIGLDPYEIASAAATKPFGYMPYSPSLGVGGHCIPCNPSYLLSNLDFPLLKQATDRMWARPASIAQEVVKSSKTVQPEDRNILVVGMGFKAGQSVLSNSPGLAFAREAQALGANVAWVDPLVTQAAIPDVHKWNERQKLGWTVASLEDHFDTVVVGVKQTGLDMDILREVEQRGNITVVWRTEKPKTF